MVQRYTIYNNNPFHYIMVKDEIDFCLILIDLNLLLLKHIIKYTIKAKALISKLDWRVSLFYYNGRLKFVKTNYTIYYLAHMEILTYEINHIYLHIGNFP